MVSKAGAQKRALSKLPYTFETNERIMSGFETKEPQLNFVERAHIGRRLHFFPDVTVTYNTGSMFDFFCYPIYPQMRLDFN